MLSTNGVNMSSSVSQADFEEACECNIGYCTTCECFCGDSVEPDAEGYCCPECGEDTLMGAEQALICGLFDLEEDEE